MIFDGKTKSFSFSLKGEGPKSHLQVLCHLIVTSDTSTFENCELRTLTKKDSQGNQST